MVDTKISALTAATTTGSLQFAAEQSGGNVKVDVSLLAASQSDMEAASSGIVFGTPGNTNWHPGVAKFFASATGAGTLGVNYNLTSRTDTGAGDITFTIATDFSSSDWILACAPNGFQDAVGASNSSARTGAFVISKAAGSIRLGCYDGAGNKADPTTNYNAAGFGDQ